MKKSSSKKNRHSKRTLILLGIILFAALGLFFLIRSLQHPQKPAVISDVPAGLSFLPSDAAIKEGDPVVIVLSDASTTAIKDAVLTGPAGGQASLHFVPYKNELISLYAANIYQKTGKYVVRVDLKNGTALSGSFSVSVRSHPEEALAIPESLGGNSPANQAHLVSELDQENTELKKLYSNPGQIFWSTPFSFPLKGTITVTDPFGYIRESGSASIIHQGTDFKAPPGTPVYAINRGVVRLAENLVAYGGTVVIDHGLGIESLYMHLSALDAAPGTVVQKGQLVGWAGETGYAEGPHLHLSIWIDGAPIDPMKFLSLFN